MTFNFVPTETVEVPGIPFEDEVVLPPADTALLIVDMQNDFVVPGGSLVTPAARDTVPTLQRLLQTARQADARVVFTQDTHTPGDPEWDIWPEHCEQDTWGWQLIEDLKPQPDELIVQKHRYDAFYNSDLDYYLTRLWEVQHLVIVGTVANICVAHTAASAGLRWFNIVVPADGISAPTEFDQALTLRQVSGLYAGSAVRSAEDIHLRA